MGIFILYKAIVINHLLKMTNTQIPYLPPEMIEYIMTFMISSTLQNCLEIKYLAGFAQKELDKRYQRCLKVLIYDLSFQVVSKVFVF